MNSNCIIFADSNENLNHSLKKFFEARGFTVFTSTDGQEVFKLIVTHKPKLAIVEMMLAKMNALQLLVQHRQLVDDNISETRIIVISNQSSIHNIKECMRLGATDYLLKPIEHDEIVPRILFHLQPPRKDLDVPSENDSANLFLHLTELILKQALNSENLDESLYKITQMTAMALKSIRASIIQCKPKQKGIVRGSSDDPKGRPWLLDLKKYPEVLSVINTGKTLAVDNLDSDQAMAEVKKFFTNIQFNSMIVTPIYTGKDNFFGVLTIRMPTNRPVISDQEVRFSQLIAQVIGITIRMYPASTLTQVE